jgi:hypothetical protein
MKIAIPAARGAGGGYGVILLLAALAISLLPARAAPPPADEGYALVRQLMSKKDGERREAARKLLQRRDASIVPALVDTLFFTPKLARAELLATLRGLTGENAGTGYYDWVELVGRRTDLAPGPGYLEWKLSLLSRIDPAYRKVFYPGAPVRIRLEEIVWGGVRLDGIPALDDPPRVAASEAGFLTGNELVFGVSAGGAHHAYPLRYLSWHEMVNDAIGGEPVTLSYCTLCDSGIAYSGRTPEGERRTFGTSGLLYRSNKLMFDRQTYTLWSNLTGEPVVGRLARSPTRLDVLPATVTTWEDWRAAHPDTTVLKLDTGFGRRWNYTYTPGAADRARAGVSFPVWLKSKALAPKAEIYALRLGSHAKAYPVERVLQAGVVNDRVGGVDLVLIGDAKSGAVRAYRRDGRTFSPAREDRELRDESGTRWRITEEALLPQTDGAPRLDRVPGHLSFWFAWYGFFPQTEIYGAARQD